MHTPLRFAAPLTGAAGALGVVGYLGGPHLFWSDGDPAMHVALGRAILSAGGLPRVDPYLQGGPAFHDHEWLFDALAAQLWRVGGPLALTTLIALIFAATAAELARQVSTQARPLAAFPALGWALAVAPMHLQARPHVLTWAFLVFGRRLIERKTTPILGWVALGAVWANLHGGFLAGIVLLGLLGGWRPALGLALGSLANPEGPWLHLGIAQFLSNDDVLSHTEDFLTPLPGVRGFPMVAFVVGEIALAAALARPTRRDVAWAACLVILTASTVRNAPLVALFVAPDIARWLQAALDRWRTPGAVEAMARVADRIRRLAPLATPAAVLALLIALIRLPAPAETAPAPLEALPALPSSGVVFATFHWGAWVALYRPEIPIVTHPLTANYADAGPRTREYLLVHNAEEGWEAAFDARRVDVAWLAPDAALVTALASKGWAEAWRDAQSVILLRPAAAAP